MNAEEETQANPKKSAAPANSAASSRRQRPGPQAKAQPTAARPAAPSP